MQRWDLLLTNANLATMAAAEGYGEVQDAALAITGETIAWAGPAAALPAGEPVRKLDLGGRWVTPGLIDCHTHLIYGGNRSGEFEIRISGASYIDIAEAGGGIRSTVAATRASSESNLLETAASRLDVLLAEGVTTVEIKSGYGLDRDTELRMLRVARQLGELYPVSTFVTYLGGHTIPEEFSHCPSDYVDIVCRLIAEISAGGLADAVDVCFDRVGFDRTQSERMLSAAVRSGMEVKLHTDQFAPGGGAGLAAAYNALSADHLEFLWEDDILAMSRAKTVAVLLPGAFYFLREVKKPPVELLRRLGVPIALATDHNPGSSPLLSLTMTMNMGSILFGLTPSETLAGVTRNAARALGLDADRGTIEKGKRADLAVWSVERPAEIGYGIGSRAAAGVIRGGLMVRNQGAFADQDRAVVAS